MATTPIEVGDNVTLTIKGKVVPAELGGSHASTVVRINRPGEWDGTKGMRVGGVTVDVVLEHAATVDVEIVSRFKNGVWCDAEGAFWMRRPDGWHAMIIAGESTTGQYGRPFTPAAVSRLVEDREST
jgi:hypothetical protein